MTKTIVILASSFRAHHRCVAGKELLPKGRGRYDVGRWVRLAHPETEQGAVPLHCTVCQDGLTAAVLDIVEVDILGPCGNAHHPEDWFFNPRSTWGKIRSVGHTALARLADEPPALWSEGLERRTVPFGYVARMERPASIYLIQAPETTRVHYWKENAPSPEDPDLQVEKLRKRISFRYGRDPHEFDVTDPEFIGRHQINERAEAGFQKQILFPRFKEVYLCLSLTPGWEGKQYKIGATIFEPHA